MIWYKSGRTCDGPPESESDIPFVLEERLRQRDLEVHVLEPEPMTSAAAISYSAGSSTALSGTFLSSDHHAE
jgi:hypothetical protein